MASTIGANGLSIVHKGSGGEANASVPDVCLTKVGKPVVPIPYGNNAKSSDLIDGSTSVTADGGNSIALQSSKFSTSTGDEGGDKKGVSSGTIKGEAQFVTSSSNVIIEGRGVARQSDQMTMNNANTMCFGVQNPPFSVEEDLEETFVMDVCVRHPNGQRLVNAPFKLTDEQGATVYENTLDERGRGGADSLKSGKVKLMVEESQDEFVVTPVRRENPHHVERLSDDAFFDIATKGQRGFWQPTRIDTIGTAWGSIGQTLSSDVYFQDMVKAETTQHFTHFHPETTFDVSKTCDAIIGNVDQPLPHTTEALLSYTMPQVLEEGELLSVLLRLAPHETTDRMLAYMRERGKGNPQTYLANYNWQAAEKTINEELDSLLNKIQGRLSFLRGEASKLQYAYLSDEVFDKHIDTLNSYMKLLPELISGVFNKMQSKAAALLANTENVKVIKAADDTHSIESESIEAVVNTTKTIDTVEPFMNEVAGVIENVIPIYPVRYGYANFFDEVMPAQAPPSMPEMTAASGLKETGGYLLRLLREGWIYIKEESEEENRPFHIFKYAQTQTATGVLEKFEKYFFTNEENAQDGLTLDTSSGSTFYPFAFVTANTQKISIAYSEHEWSAVIIDKINGNKDLRKKSMQQVDLSSPQTEFSQEATQENLSALVEDYRNNDEKWLADKDSAKPMPHGLDLATTTLSYHLAAEGVVETMQKSHSEHKDGTLVALFDPTGRQAELAYALTQMTVWEEVDRANKHYPREIANILNRSFLSKRAPQEVQQAAQENLNMEALTQFNQETKSLEAGFSERRNALLDVYAAFSYQDLADGSIGSLDLYLKMFFDIESEALQHPEVEAEKIAGLVERIFEGVSSSQEGQELLISMVDHAYQNDGDLQSSHNSYFLLTEQLKKVLTQCQYGTDWEKSTQKASAILMRTPEVFGNLWVNARATHIYGQQLAKEFRSKLSVQAISQIAESILPTFYRQVFGITFTDSTVGVSQDKLAEMLAKHIDSGGKNTTSFRFTESNLSWAKKLMDKAKLRKAEYQAKVYDLPEIKLEWGPFLNGDVKVGAVSNAVGTLAGGALAGWSWLLNQETLYSVLSQSNFESVDPLADSKATYDTLNLIASLAAITVDSASVGSSALRLTEQGLRVKNMPGLSAKMLPKVSAGQLKLDRLLTAKSTSRFIAGANFVVAFSEGMKSFDDWQSGNQGGAIGHVALSASAVTFGISAIVFGGGTATTAVMVTNVIGFVLLVIGGLLTWAFSKSIIENLLYRCFWGNSKIYSFWYFVDEGEVSMLKRLNLATGLTSRRELQLAFDIEMQEFTNLLLQPSVSIERDGGLLSEQKEVTYQFKLPGFVAEVSEIVGSIQRHKVDVMQPIQNMAQVELDVEATNTITDALVNAMESSTLKDGNLELTVKLTLHKDAQLYWYYQPQPGVITPKRWLEEGSLVKQAYIGMKDDELL